MANYNGNNCRNGDLFVLPKQKKPNQKEHQKTCHRQVII